jgi:pilus assembly protein Flp/PilA
MQTLIMRFLRNQSGATAIEYGLIVSFIALLCIVTLQLAGTNMSNKFESVSSALN